MYLSDSVAAECIQVKFLLYPSTSIPSRYVDVFGTESFGFGEIIGYYFDSLVWSYIEVKQKKIGYMETVTFSKTDTEWPCLF